MALGQYRVYAIYFQGILFAWQPYVAGWIETLLGDKSMAENQDRGVKEKTDAGSSLSLETRIAMGLFGWLALSMALMGLGIW